MKDVFRYNIRKVRKPEKKCNAKLKRGKNM